MLPELIDYPRYIDGTTGVILNPFILVARAILSTLYIVIFVPLLIPAFSIALMASQLLRNALDEVSEDVLPRRVARIIDMLLAGITTVFMILFTYGMATLPEWSWSLPVPFNPP